MAQTISEKLKVHTVYHNQSGKRVPSVTTYLHVLNKPALLKWAWECGLEGIDYTKVRDNAADIGTLAHYLVLCHLASEAPDVTEYSPADLEKAETCLLKFWEWERSRKIEPIMLEEPLVSEEFQYGGTIDFYGRVDGIPTLLDFKTGKGVYDEMLYQVAAYARLLREHLQDVRQVKILRIGRNPEEGFEERTMDSARMVLYFDVFLACQKIYTLQKRIRKG